MHVYSPSSLSLIIPSPYGRTIAFAKALRSTFIVSGFKNGYVTMEIKLLKVGSSHKMGFKIAVMLWKRCVAEWVRLAGGGLSQNVVQSNAKMHESMQR